MTETRTNILLRESWPRGFCSTSQREAFRRFLTTAVIPLGELVAEELSAKLEAPVRFGFGNLYAHDLAGRAQAFGKLVAGGMDFERAVAVSGLLGG